VDVRRNLENSEFNVGRPSYYFFDPLFFSVDAPYRQAAGVDPGIVSGAPAELATNVRHWRNIEFGGYFQDDWKIARRLTLNLGLRYDLYTRHVELNNLATTFIPGPGNTFIDSFITGAGQVHDANTPCLFLPGGVVNKTAQLAGTCGPGGFAPTKELGAGDHNNFGPRIGFAWDVFGDAKTSLRGGYGVSYEGTLYNPLSNSRWNPPYYSFNRADNFLNNGISYIIYGPTICNPACQPNRALAPSEGGPGTNPGQGVGVQDVGNLVGWDSNNPNLAFRSGLIFPEGIRDPYIHNYYLGFQHELVPKVVMELDYVGTAGHKLFRAENINRIPGGLLPLGTCTVDNFGRTLCGQEDENFYPGTTIPINTGGALNANYGQLRAWRNAVNSNYNGLQAALRVQSVRGVSFNVNYTWSHSIDDGSTWHSGATTGNGAAAGDGFTTDFTIPNVDRGNSVYDVRHRLVANYVWELPWFNNATNGVLRNVFGGWQLNGIWAFQTGLHWSAFRSSASRLSCTGSSCENTGGDFNLDNERNDRPDYSGPVTFDHDQWANGIDASGFTSPCLACVGSLGRNALVGPNLFSVDMSLFKTFKFTERVGLQFRAEGFNVFNRANFLLPGANFSGHNRTNSPLFGVAAGTLNPRQMQLGLKLNF
jgi:TonB dependent receptor